jgi:winged helix DNA-binding protein
MARSRYPVLDNDQLNRATLARQGLLEPLALDPVVAVERVGALQAQEAASPYIALWSRLAAFDPDAVDRAFLERRLVKATLMRVTLHVVSSADYVRILPALRPMLELFGSRFRGGVATSQAVAEFRDAVIAFAAEPRTNVELRDHVVALTDGRLGDEPWWHVKLHVPFVHAPSETPWSFGRRPTLLAAAAWFGDDDYAAEAASIEHLVRRYLGAFGPATAADASTWSGLPVARVRLGLAAIDEAGELRRFSDERGRELVDLAGAPLPDPRTPAPPRLLPMWDSLLLAHADRTRVVPEEFRPLVVARNGDTLPSFLVDGRVAGLWWAESHAGGARIALEPFRRLPRAVTRELQAVAERLAVFVGDREPAVYGRYRGTRARRVAVPAIRSSQGRR